MEIKLTEKSSRHILAPGKTVFLRVFGSDPLILIQQGEDMVVDSMIPDTTSKSGKTWRSSKYPIHETWIVRDKRGNFILYPAAALTTEEPDTSMGFFPFALLTLVASTSPFWILELLKLL